MAAFGASLGVAALTVNLATTSGDGSPIELILGLLPAIPALLFGLAAAQRWEGRNSVILEHLTQTPRRIIWVYVNEIEGASRKCIYLQKADGSSLALSDVTPEAVEPVLVSLRARLPHAVFGYTDDTRKRYGTNPK